MTAKLYINGMIKTMLVKIRILVIEENQFEKKTIKPETSL